MHVRHNCNAFHNKTFTYKVKYSKRVRVEKTVKIFTDYFLMANYEMKVSGRIDNIIAEKYPVMALSCGIPAPIYFRKVIFQSI